MNIEEFLRLVGTVEISDDHDGLYPEAKEIGMYHSYIRLDSFIEVMQRNGLEVKKKKITAWSIAEDFSKYSRYLGVDEAHDVIVAWCRKYGIRKDKHPPKKIKTSAPIGEATIVSLSEVKNIKPVCAQDIEIERDCTECKSDIDCGGAEARENHKQAIYDMYKHGLK